MKQSILFFERIFIIVYLNIKYYKFIPAKTFFKTYNIDGLTSEIFTIFGNNVQYLINLLHNNRIIFSYKALP